MIRVFRGLRDLYDLSFASYKPLTSKTYRLKTKEGLYYFTKKSELFAKEKYNFLYHQGIKNIFYPLRNRLGEFVSDYGKQKYFVSEYVGASTVLKELQARALLEELTDLHERTFFKRQLSADFSRRKMELLFEYLQYKFNVLEAYVRTLETREFDEFSIPVLKNYRHLLEAKKIMGHIHRRLVSDIKEKKSVYFAFVHNNPRISHLLLRSGKRFLTSIERAKVGITSLDLAKFYINSEDINIDRVGLVEGYLQRFDDDFYRNYFCFLVLLYYLQGIILYDKDYVSCQSFLYASSSIRDFLSAFSLNKDKTE
ncbi:MAG: hypothetical protein WBK54_04170 [Bacilli bacterium]|jgi:hypothetical protein|nr:hypothetical protein [Acholeplasmataceae bacterium]